MMPNEYRAALAAPDAEKNTVVVEAKRELLPVEYEEPIPIWPLGPLWWGAQAIPRRAGGFSCPTSTAPEEGPRRRRAAAYLPLGPVSPLRVRC